MLPSKCSCMCIVLQLWRMSFPADKFCWQRLVGLMQQQVAHPDSWTALISLQHSSSHSSRGGQHTSSLGRDLQDFMSLRHSSARYKCTCSRCPHSADVQAAAVTETAAQPAADAAASMARARLRLRAGLKLGPLQVRGASTAAATTATTPVAGTPAAAVDAAVTDTTCSGSANGADPGRGTSCVGGSSSGGADSHAGSNAGSSSSSSSVWPACWSCEDVAGLCRLAQAEELLETAVHALLGIGADSSTELYEKLQQMTRGARLLMQVCAPT